MATKKEVWFDDAGDEHESELSALVADFDNAVSADCVSMTSGLCAAIDALHEYAHRNDAKKEKPTLRRALVVDGRYFTVGNHEVHIVAKTDSGLFVDEDGDHFTSDGMHIHGTRYGARPNYNIDWERSP